MAAGTDGRWGGGYCYRDGSERVVGQRCGCRPEAADKKKKRDEYSEPGARTARRSDPHGSPKSGWLQITEPV
jgi:hypothetical protein